MYYIMYSELTTIILGEKLHTDILVSTFPYLRIYLNAFAADARPRTPLRKLADVLSKFRGHFLGEREGENDKKRRKVTEEKIERLRKERGEGLSDKRVNCVCLPRNAPPLLGCILLLSRRAI